MRRALKDVVESAQKYIELKDTDYVVDIGANDGTLLRNYPRNINCVAYEPSDAIDMIRLDMIRIKKLFSNIDYINNGWPRAKIITAIAMFYDLNEPFFFLGECRSILDDEGVLIIQMNYLLTMVDNLSFDNISHEHLCYYSIRDMVHLCERANLYIQDAQLNDINGGSIRFYIKKITDKPSGKSDRLAQLIEAEERWYELVDVWTRIRDMKSKVDAYDYTLRRQLSEGTPCAIGASTRGYVLLQYYGLDEFIDIIIERNPEKIGKTLGNYTIKDEKALDEYDKALILPYFFRDEIRARSKDYKGEFLYPIPL
jgi:hypothetical protein